MQDEYSARLTRYRLSLYHGVGRLSHGGDDDGDRLGRKLDADALQALVTQLEYYFSDANLAVDNFLFNKTMKHESTAWVHTKVILTFPRLKRTCVSAAQVIAAVEWRASAAGMAVMHGSPALLEMSDDGHKIRRMTAIPDVHKIRVENFPDTMLVAGGDGDKALLKYFVEKYGAEAVKSAKVVFPSGRGKKNNRRDRPYGHVLLESNDLVVRAVKDHAGGNWRQGLQVKRAKPEKHVSTNVVAESDQNQKQADDAKDKSKEQESKSVATPKQKNDLRKECIGKVRTLDRNNLCVYILPETRPETGGSRGGKKGKCDRSARAVLFDCSSDSDLFAKLKVGLKVMYMMMNNQVTELALYTDASGAAAEEEEAGRPRLQLKQTTVKTDSNAAPVSANCGYYASGPTNSSSAYLGFTTKEWRGLLQTPRASNC